MSMCMLMHQPGGVHVASWPHSGVALLHGCAHWPRAIHALVCGQFVTSLALTEDRLLSQGYRCFLAIWDLTTFSILHKIERTPPPEALFAGSFIMILSNDSKKLWTAQVARPDEVAISTLAEVDVETGTVNRMLDTKIVTADLRVDDRRLVCIEYNSSDVHVWDFL